ncbi:MAG: carbamoyltransferase HypF [Clostridiales Family XIII bacterium]|jgi:hydrogenase maturation protein HypF|nr:carbamoyltransferase HypF [Clostridiales Family XIII bacterium]
MDSGTIREKIFVEGRVQGIGFRPHIYRLAVQHDIRGFVRNSGGMAEILAEGSASSVEAFVSAVADTATMIPLARIDKVVRIREERTVGKEFPIFFIEQSDETQRAGEILPDVAICAQCEAELAQEGRRYAHYFNNCTVCGPRFTVAKSLPYDRQNTSMDAFVMCDDCAKEYTTPEDRRFHAETLCCDVCGPVLRYRSKGVDLFGDDAFSACVQDLSENAVVLIKGVGGYHLAASPYSTVATRSLRTIKDRETKPFAVMFSDLEQIRKICRVNVDEESLLHSIEKPIVLLRLKEDTNPFTEDVLRGNKRCGCFLPYTALHVLLLRQLSALVLTSANASGRPILYEDEEALSFYAMHEHQISGILYHDRKIVRPAEDSVIAINCGAPQLLRIGRGYAPLSIRVTPESPIVSHRSATEIFAAGSDLKASFCFYREGAIYGSAYYGDLEDTAVFERFQNGVFDLETIFSVHPTVTACDLHPRYFSSAFAQDMASKRGLACMQVQHHHAHIASVMAEQKIHERVIGVAFDGTGYGEDGSIWGGEFLCCEGGTYQSVAQLAQTRILGGDDSAKDAAKTAVCYLSGIDMAIPEDLSDDIPLIQSALRVGMGFLSSGMGRLFDVVAALLGLCRENTYEGQCAIALQQAAEACLEKRREGKVLRFKILEQGEMIRIDYEKILRAAAVCHEKDVEAYALGFHEAIAQMVADVCSLISEKKDTKKVVLSGGVFQNTLLTELCFNALKQKDLEVYINRRVPPNDGGIAFGQIFVVAAKLGQTVV